MTEETRAALAKALRRLETSDRYESEVRSVLSGYPESVVEEVVSILKAKRYLDDGRTAANEGERNVGRRAVGAARFRERMERRGAPEALVEAATEKVRQGERTAAAEWLTRRFGERKPEDRVRAARFLLGRGFDEDVVEACLAEHFGDVE